MKNMLPNGLITILAALFISVSALAQTPPSNLSGSSLRDWFKTNYYTGLHTQLGYTDARRKMYNYIDNKNNTITGVYGGYEVSWTYGGTGTNPQPINCEHTVPQSYFDYNEPMKSDIHHLFPTLSNWNSTRSNHPFADIDDNSTTKWMIDNTSQTGIPASNIDGYSEYASSQFEPREEHKGNLARAVFYFYTMYPNEGTVITDVAPLQTLYDWHLADPIDQDEIDRNNDIFTYQGNKNPYIIFPDLVDEAFEINGSGGSGSTPDLIISEYIEGSSNNKAIELANLSGGSVDLSDYTLKKQTNGAGSWGTALALSGTLADGEVYTIAHASASSSLTSIADLTTSSTAMTFNGNDPVGLFKNDVLIDIVGTFDGGSSSFAQNVTLVRQNSITVPNPTYSSNEWDQYGQDEFTYFGAHGSTSGGSGELFISEYIEGSSYNKAIEIGNLTGGSVDLSDYTLKKQTNGAGSWSTALSLSGTLADGEAYAIAHSSASSSLTSAADLTTGSSVMSFNGNDPVGLFKNDVLVDIVGTFDGGSSNFAKDITIVRNSTVTAPNTTYTTSEWDQYGQDEFSYFGSLSTSGNSGSDLFISEYIEGSSYSKAIEIGNLTGADVDLSDYTLKKQTNGAGSWSSALSLSGTLTDGSAYAVAHSSASSSLITNADLTTSSSVVNFNGNDPVGLFKNDVLIDVVGTFNGGSSNFAKDVTLVRNSSISDPNTTYTTSEWDQYGQNTFTYFGTLGSAKFAGFKEASEAELNIYPNPAQDVVHILPSAALVGQVQLQIVNVTGQVVQSATLNLAETSNILDISELDAGIYLLQIKHLELLKTVRLVVQ